MYSKVMNHCANLTFNQVCGLTLVLAMAIEAFTVWCRFGLGMQSTRDTGLIGEFTGGVRIHHGYIGLLLMVCGLIYWPKAGFRNLLFMIGGALVLSDLMHHFLVLWPVTGSPQFDIFYPAPGQK